MDGLVRIPCPRCSVREEITPPRAGVHGECLKCGHTWTWTEEEVEAMTPTCTCSPSILDPLCPVDEHREVAKAAGLHSAGARSMAIFGMAVREVDPVTGELGRFVSPASLSRLGVKEVRPRQVIDAEPEGGEWCLVRYLDDKFCGPLSPITAHTSPRSGGLGFPSGKIGLVAWFSSSEEAVAASTDPRDKPTRAADLHFSAHDYNHYNRRERCFYDGGDYRLATAAVALRERQIALEESAPGYFRVEVKCRLTANVDTAQALTGEPPSSPLYFNGEPRAMGVVTAAGSDHLTTADPTAARRTLSDRGIDPLHYVLHIAGSTAWLWNAKEQRDCDLSEEDQRLVIGTFMLARGVADLLKLGGSWTAERERMRKEAERT